jgi:hypothetical protein
MPAPLERDAKLACPACASVEGLPLQEWAQAQAPAGRNATRLPWGQEVAFEEVDYAGAAEVVCNCLAGAGLLLHACQAGRVCAARCFTVAAPDEGSLGQTSGSPESGS